MARSRSAGNAGEAGVAASCEQPDATIATAATTARLRVFLEQEFAWFERRRHTGDAIQKIGEATRGRLRRGWRPERVRVRLITAACKAIVERTNCRGAFIFGC